MSDSDIFLKLAKKQESTAQRSPPPTSTLTDKEQPMAEEINESVQTDMRARMQSTRSSDTQSSETSKNIQAHTNVHTHARVEQDLRRILLNKKHMSTFTFRFKPEELDALDKAVQEVNSWTSQKVSKNDIVRLGVNWLLKDYDINKENGMLAKVIKALNA